MSTLLLALTLLPGLAGYTNDLTPVRAYVPVHRPIMVTIRQSGAGMMGVILLSHDGEVLDGLAEIEPGEIDVAQALPAIWSLRKAAYVQLMDNEGPIGSALVVEPMLSRLEPRTETAVRPDGVTKYTRIVGWGKAVEPAPDAGKDRSAPHEEGKAPASAAPDEGTRDTTPLIFSGFRLYVDQDVLLHTSHGFIRLAMRPDEAPNTVRNFRQLVADGFYDGLTFHRIVPFRAEGTRFVIQGGDPNGDGEGGPGWWLPMERSMIQHDFGTIGMARDDHPDSAGSQFFISLSREGTQHLDGQYCAFGHAVSGAATIRAIAEVELADVKAGRPVQPPVITKAELVPGPPRAPGSGRPDRKVEDAISNPPPPEGPRQSPDGAPPDRPGQVPR